MRSLHLTLFIIVLAVIATACIPNRLNNALDDKEAAEPVVVPTPDGRNLQPQLENANIDLDEVVALLPPDGIPAILPEEVPTIMVTAEEAEALGMDPTVRVLGLEINGESRAYPIPFMSEHEIVNDEVGGRLIAATW